MVRTEDAVSPTIDDLLTRIAERGDAGKRLVVGIAGEPGAGKSTVAAELVRRLGDRAVLVGMDGFHLANRVLREQTAYCASLAGFTARVLSTPSTAPVTSH